MDFDEFAAMSRELGELAPLDSAEYKNRYQRPTCI